MSGVDGLDVRRSALRDIAPYIIVAVAVTLPALGLRLTGFGISPVLGALAFGVAMIAAGFMLSWAAETAEQDIPRGLVLAVLALVTVLPEYVVDLYLAFQAGRDPAGEYTALATANMTGANRLLIGVAWPLVVLISWLRGGGGVVRLGHENLGEIAYLGLATLYSFVIWAKASITLVDMVVLLAIFGLYLYRQSRNEPARAGEAEGELAIGPPAILLRLPNVTQWAAIIALAVFAGAVILLSAEPFAESLIAAGATLNLDDFLLIQWVAPVASEAPAVIVASLFAVRLRASRALGTLVSDKINQWTLLVGMIPLFFAFGAGRPLDFPLDARQSEEFFLTAAQSVFAVAIITRQGLSVRGALVLLGLFLAQFSLGFILRADQELSIAVLTGAGWIYLVLGAAALLWNRAYIPAVIAQGLFDRHDPRAADGSAGGAS